METFEDIYLYGMLGFGVLLLIGVGIPAAMGLSIYMWKELIKFFKK